MCLAFKRGPFHQHEFLVDAKNSWMEIPLKVGLAKMGFYVVGSAVFVPQFWIRGAACLHRLSPCVDV